MNSITADSALGLAGPSCPEFADAQNQPDARRKSGPLLRRLAYCNGAMRAALRLAKRGRPD
jgi:hypothetical protein